jgi:hypothetical protein
VTRKNRLFSARRGKQEKHLDPKEAIKLLAGR